MRLAVLYSGGKDSNLALHKARQEGHEIASLVGVVPEATHSFMYHVPTTEWLELFAQAVGEKLTKVRVPENDEMRPVRNAIASLNVDGVATGAVRSDFQRLRVDRLCEELGLKHYAPLWHIDPLAHMRELLGLGFDIIFTAVAAEGLDERWLGRLLDEKAIEALVALNETHGINIEGEGGEYETLVLSGPTHRKRVVLDGVEKVWLRDSGRLRITGAHLE
jgi:ABC transporter with metal-binding/Fe-S-binding domain ATP-binding protein